MTVKDSVVGAYERLIAAYQGELSLLEGDRVIDAKAVQMCKR
jgi:hypothetical protein